jgi:putative membrane protein
MSTVVNGLKRVSAALVTFALVAGPALAQPGPGPGPGPGGEGPGRYYGYGPRMMMGWGDGRYGQGHGVLFAVVCLFALIGLVAVVVAATRMFGRGYGLHRHGNRPGLEALESRYARGEINREEFLEKKRDLTTR